MAFLDGCVFCADTPEKRAKLTERVLESDNFMVFPTVGQIVEGYLLIVSKEHYACFGAMPDSILDELIELKKEVDRRVTKAYQKPIYFEHGGIGQTIFHAHMHVIPFPMEKEEKVFDAYRNDFPINRRLNSLKDLQQVWKKDGMYLFYEVNDHKFSFFTHIMPMYARIVVANALDTPERANWRTMDRDLDNRLIESTLQKLKCD